MRARTRFLLDLLIACGLIAAYQPTWTGISLHEWVSVAIMVPLAIHLVVNWEWCVRVARTFFQRLFHASRANFVVDAGLMAASVAVMLSGIVVSEVPSWFGVRIAQYAVWAELHALSADAIMVLFLVHAVLHRAWIVATARRLAAELGAMARADASTPARAMALTPASGAQSVGSQSPAQSRRSARLAAEKAAARRKTGALGVATVTLALGSLIFASVAIAGPALSGRLGTQPTASTVIAKAPRRAAARRPASPAPAAPTAPAQATQSCPRTGCAAVTCHGSSGVSASVWYKTHG